MGKELSREGTCWASGFLHSPSSAGWASSGHCLLMHWGKSKEGAKAVSEAEARRRAPTCR